MNAFHQTRVLRNCPAISIILTRKPIAASITSIKLNLFEHEPNKTKTSVRCMTTARLSECLEQTSQKNANAIQIYEDVWNNIKQKRKEARAGRDLELAVDLGCLQLECKSYLRKRIERPAWEAAENASTDPAENENSKTLLNNTQEIIRRMAVDWEDSSDLHCEGKDSPNNVGFRLLYEKIRKLNCRYDKEVVVQISEIVGKLKEVDTEALEALDKLSEVEEELEDIWKEAIQLMKDKGLDDSMLGIL